MYCISLSQHDVLLKSYTVTDTSAVGIGRHFTNDIVLSDKENRVSRFHAAIFAVSDGRFTFQDLGSKNGSCINGKKQAYGTLHDGDKIDIGTLSLVFSIFEGKKKTPNLITFTDDEKSRRKFQLPATEIVLSSLTEGTDILDQHPEDLRLLYRLVRSISGNEGIEENLQIFANEILKRFAATRVVIGLLDKSNNEPHHIVQSPDDQRDFLLSTTTFDQIQKHHHVMHKQSVESGAMGRAPKDVITISLGVWDQMHGIIQLTREVGQLSSHELVLLHHIIADIARFLDHHFYMSTIVDESTALAHRLSGEKVMIGISSHKKRTQELITEIAATDDTVLITGESGTGKDLAAELIHMQSRRNKKPFVVVNCSAIPEGLLESEMFGYKKGAHATAHSDFRGKFEMAHTGTIFLNEIGEMSNTLQAKLLDVIERKVVWPLGAEQPKTVDVRIIAATNKNLKESMKDGKFRKDLYQRLNIQTLSLSPLRERREDIPILAGYFLCRERQNHVKRIDRFSNRCMDMMIRYSWPGNVRELSNAIKRAMTRCKKTTIGFHDLGIDPDYDEPLKTLEEIEKEHIRRVLEVAGSKEEAARILGIVKQTLYEKGRKYRLSGFQGNEKNEGNEKTTLT